MKNIVCLIDSLAAGGAQRQMVVLSRLLKENGYKVIVLTYHDIPFYKQYLDRYCIPNRNIDSAANHRKRIFRIRKELKDLNPDIVIAYLDVPSIVAVCGKLLGGKYRLIVSERNTTQHLTIKARIKFFLFRFADAIVSNSESQTEYIKSRYPRLSKKTYTITNCVDTDFFKPEPALPSSSELRLLTVGRITEQKNVLRYIDAIAILIHKGANIRADWFGDYFSDYYDQCLQKIKEYGIEDNFHFHPATGNILPEYQKADAFCLPSVYEGFPNVICEAMACGKPILCGNVCDNPSMVQDGVGGILFDPFSIDSMMSAIRQMAELDNERRAEMGRINRIKAEQQFSRNVFIQKYVNLIEKQN